MNNALLKERVSNWDQKDLSFISAIVKGAGPEFEFKHAVVTRSLARQYKHLDIFTDKLKINKKGIEIIKLLQKEYK